MTRSIEELRISLNETERHLSNSQKCREREKNIALMSLNVHCRIYNCANCQLKLELCYDRVNAILDPIVGIFPHSHHLS